MSQARRLPRARARINWKNPIIARGGLAFVYLPGLLVNLVDPPESRTRMVVNNGASRRGSAILLNGTAGNGLIAGTGPQLGGLSTSTVFAVAATNRTSAIYCERPPSGPAIYKLEVTSNGGAQFTYRNDNNVLYQVTTGTNSLNSGGLRFMALTRSNGFHAVYGGMIGIDGGNFLNSGATGFQSGTGNGAPTTDVFANPAVVRTIGYDAQDPLVHMSGRVELLIGFSRALSAAEIRSLKNDPAQIFMPYDDEPVMIAAAPPPSSQGVTPATGGLSLAGYPPNLGQTATLALSPAPAAIGVTGYAPTVIQSASSSLSPNPAPLGLTGQTPTVARTANLDLSPAACSLGVTGAAPTVSQPSGIVPGAGTVGLTGYAPAIARTASVAASTSPGALTMAGQAPAVAQSANVAVSPSPAALGLAGNSPAVRQAQPGVGIYPPPSRVAAGVQYGPNGDDYTGTYSPGLTPDQADMLAALAKVHGLVRGTPLVVGQTSRTAGDVVQTIAESGGTVTITRA